MKELLHSYLQGASNGAANTVAIPIDVLAAVLRKGGIPVPSDAVGGSEWMAKHGLTAQPKNKVAGEFGENTSALIQALMFGKIK